MATTIKLKNSVTTTNAPSSLVQGEVAINITDKKVWVGNAATTPIQLLGDGGSVNFTTVDTTNLQVTNIKAKDGTASASIANSTGAFTVAAAFAANGGATLGDASGDALTINSSAVSIPNGLNFDSNTLVIDAANNLVGIGTSSPAQRLHVVGNITLNTGVAAGSNGFGISVYASDFPRLSFRNSTTGDTTADGLQMYMVGSDAIYNLLETGYQAWHTSNTERMRIDSSGNVGIGTSSPSSLGLSIAKTAGTATGISLYQTSTEVFRLATDNAAIYVQGRTGLPMQFYTNETERMRITSTGNVLIGASSVSDIPKTLNVSPSVLVFNPTSTVGQTADFILSTYNANFAQTAAATFQTVLNNTTTGANDFYIKQFNHNSGSSGNVVFQANSGSSGYVSLYTVNTERMRIHASGGVSIGNTTDSGAASLNVSGSISGGYIAHAAGTTAMAFGSDNVVRVTPNATATYTTTVPAAGAICVLSILTSGTTSYTITFGTGFKSTGTLATGTVSARYFNITFVSDGTNLIEMSRTVAIA